jgi:putative hydrolase of the HAD superfamily
MAHVAGAELQRFTGAYWELRPAYDRGDVDARAYWSLLGEAVGAPVDAELAAGLLERDIALWSRVDERMLAWAHALVDAGVRVGLLSNMVAEIGTHLRDELRLFEGFASVTYSYEVGLAKPDPGIYHHALESLGVAPQETLFVDDRIRNVEAAHGVGMHAHHFCGHDELISEIDERYVFVSERS